jgi:hypothetical protein
MKFNTTEHAAAWCRIKASKLVAGFFAMAAAWLSAVPVLAQSTPPTLNYMTLDFGTYSTFVTGIRGNTITGQYVIPNGGGTGGLIYSITSQIWTPFPVATSSGINFPGAIDNTPYGPSFGSDGVSLRVVGSYQTQASAPYNLSYLYDGAAAPGSQLTTLQYPSTENAQTLETIAHSTFDTKIVGNYDTRLATGNAFIYDIPSGTYTTNNKPLAVSTTAYGIWGGKIAGGYAGPSDAPGVMHGYIFDMTTGNWTSYNHPGAVTTHFEGITSAGPAGAYNLATDWIDANGQIHAAVLNLDALGNTNWVELAVPGAVVTSANSGYQGTVIGVYTDSAGVIHGFTVAVPGIYTPPPTPLLAAILPDARSVEVGTPATVFATMLNTGASSLSGCQIALPPDAPPELSLTYQTTNPTTNALTGQPNQPATIAGNGGQSFVLGFTATTAMNLTAQNLSFICAGVPSAPAAAGLNTIDLAFSTDPITDIIALGATPSNNGILIVPFSQGQAGAFAVASANAGAPGALTVVTDTGSYTLPIAVTLCATVPSTGQCLAAPTSTVALDFAAGATPTFSIFVTASAAIQLNPQTARLFVRFIDASGMSHGSTSVAVATQ